MIASAPISAPASRIAPAQMRAPAPTTSGGGASREAEDLGPSTTGLPRIAPSWTETPSPSTTPPCTTTLAPNVTPSPIWASGCRKSPGASVAAMADTLIAVGSHEPPRGAVIGLGMMGRHHARILQSHPAMRFAGAVDPGGDRFGAVRDPGAVHPSIDALLAGGTPDFAVIAVPTEEHLGT